ncbi:MAG: sulfatase-like hydrolase/transferase [Myxococcota bacterium]
MSSPSHSPPAASSSPPAPRRGRTRRAAALGHRVAVSAAAGSIGGLALAALDVRWVQRAVGLDETVSTGTLFGANAGILAPVSLLCGVLVGLLSWGWHPQSEPTFARARHRLRAFATGRPADIAAFVPLAAGGLFFWTTACAQSARWLLALDASPRFVGVALAAMAVAWAVVTAFGVLTLTPALRRRLAALSGKSRWAVDPAFTLAVAFVAVALAFGAGVWAGDVSGRGGGPLGIYGIFKRPELDLRLPLAMTGLIVVVYLAPAHLRGLRASVALATAVLPLGLTGRAAVRLNDAVDAARLIERSAPVARGPLRWWRRATDRDRDGASPWFGGGDCDDRDPAVGPAADDLPDNGIDEDCSGSDLTLAGLDIAPEPTSPARATAAEGPLPSAVTQGGNLVLITIDTLRHDLGYAGYERPISPHLDALAARSVAYTRAYALASYTGKSVGPMLIGKYGSETHRNWGHFNTFGSEDTFVTERLDRAGFHTIAVHGHHYFGAFGGLERGFDVLDLSAAPPESAPWAKADTVTSAKLTDAAILRLRERPRDQRFFLWVHYLDPHADYKTHEGVPHFGRGARALYDHEVAYTDREIGRLLEALDADQSAQPTSIIVTSDHGEAFGENGMWRHGVEVWETLVRVPLIVHVPGVAPRRVKARRSHIDLVPTMLDLAGLPAVSSPAATEGHDFVSGRSLVPDWYAADGAVSARDVIVDMPAGPYNESRRAFIHGDLKLIVSRGANKELFDLGTDPEERRNVWAARRDEIEARYALAKRRLREQVVTGPRR